jgi:hypothetical protein
MKHSILYYYYYLTFWYAALCFGIIAMAMVPIMAICYADGILRPDGGNWPLSTIPFIAVYGVAGYIIRKAAIHNIQRIKQDST